MYIFDSDLGSINLPNNPNLMYLRIWNCKINKLDVSRCKTILEQIGRGSREENGNITYQCEVGAFLWFDKGVELVTE